MFKDLRIIIINNIWKTILVISIVIAIYFIYTSIINETSSTTESINKLSNIISSNESDIYNNTILTGSQVLTAIRKYYDNEDVMILLLNNRDDYNNTGYRFWVTGKGGKYGQNANYESIIISNDYNKVTGLLIQDKSINSKYNKRSLDSYSDSNEKNYINISHKYKSILLKCNGYTMGIAFLAI